jgi:hypothetical protein
MTQIRDLLEPRYAELLAAITRQQPPPEERRRRAATDAGLPPHLGTRLEGHSQTELNADARLLADMLGITPDPTDPTAAP